jgi:hypothetical protein
MEKKICPVCRRRYEAQRAGKGDDQYRTCPKSGCVKKRQRVIAKDGQEAWEAFASEALSELDEGWYMHDQGQKEAPGEDVKPAKVKPKSHVVELKEKVKARILGKAQGHASTKKTEPPQGTDVPPLYEVDEVNTKIINDRLSYENKVELHRLYEDATAGLPPEALPVGSESSQLLQKAGIAAPWKATPLPVQHHGTQNDLSKSVISKVPATKLDPNSEEAELARLLNHQLPRKKV